MAQITVYTGTGSDISSNARPTAIQVDNGNLWVARNSRATGDIKFYYSTNKGASWTYVSRDLGSSFPVNCAIYSVGGFVWCFYDDIYGPSNNYMYFDWGTFNAARTDITWNGGTTIYSGGSDYSYAFGMVVHAEGAGYKAHLVSSNRFYADHRYTRLDLNSSGAYTSTEIATNWSTAGIETADVCRINIDPATKDIFLHALTSRGGGTYEVWYQKRAYTGATWPAGTTRILGTQVNYNQNMEVAFDGDRTVCMYYDEGEATHSPTIVERDKADTTTTTRTPPTGVTGSMDNATGFSLTTNAQQDILMAWNDVGTDPTDFYKNTYTRATNSWSGATLVRDTTPNTSVIGAYFIAGTKYFFFWGEDHTQYMLDDMLEVAYTGSATMQGVATLSATPLYTLLGGGFFPRLLIEVAFATDPTSENPVWTEITEYVRSFNIRRGRNRELDVFEPGNVTLILDNDDRRFEPTNTSSPYYPNVVPAKRIRIRAIFQNAIYDVFTGYVGGWPQQYPTKHTSVVSVDAYDGLGFLSFAQLEISRPQEFGGSRIGSILDEAMWPASDRMLETGVEELAAINNESGSALSLLQKTGQTELGYVYAGKDGKIYFHGRNHIFYDPHANKGTWSDSEDGSDYSYEDLVPSEDETEIRNRVTVTRTGGEPQTAEDATSQAKYFLRDYIESDLPLLNDVAALSRAEFQILRYKDPQLRFNTMEILPRADDSFAAVLDLELSDRITVERFSASSPIISQTVFIDAINHDVDRDDKSWKTTLTLTPQFFVEDFWLIGTSLLGIDTKLAF